MTLIELWESSRISFVEIAKSEFDKLYRNKEFDNDPLVEEPSSFMKEYGPYNPERWAFGILKDGKKVCAKVFP